MIWVKSWTSYPDVPRRGVDVHVRRRDTAFTAADYLAELHAAYEGAGVSVTRDGMKLTVEYPKASWCDRHIVVEEYSDTPLMLNPDEYQGSL